MHDLVWFFGISTIFGYFMPSPVFTYIYIKYVICNTVCKYTLLNDQAVLFLTIQFIISQQNKCSHVLLCLNNNSVKYQLSVYTLLKDQIVTFEIIQIRLSHLFVSV